MKMVQMLKKFASIVTVTTCVFASTVSTYACSAFYMGKDTTENGSVIWGRSEDISASFRKLFMVKPAETHAPGEYYETSVGFKWPYPQQTLRYTLCKDSYHNERHSPEPYAEVGINEKNVAISATVTLSSVKSGITGSTGVDPFVSNPNGGLAEEDLATVVLMQATTAREAVELVAHIVDTVGSAGREGFMVSDPNEVWYMQILSGHQYVAVKAPSDKIAFSPNMTGNIDITDTENVITSPDLIDVAQRAGTLVTDDNGNIKIADSYATKPSSVGNRLWQGYYYLKGQETAEALQANYIDFFIEPRETEKYTLFEAMRLLAFRGEGTVRDAGSSTGNSAGIGNDATVEAHVIETRKNMPDALASIEWLCMAPPEFGVYLPFYGSLITDTFEKYYSPDVTSYNNDDPDENSMYYVFRELYTLCKGPRGATGVGSRDSRTRYGANVIKFWERYQKSLIEQQAAVDEEMIEIYNFSPELASQRATQLSIAISKETHEYAKQILSELKAFQAAGTEGDFTPSVLLDENALPHYSTSNKYMEKFNLLVEQTGTNLKIALSSSKETAQPARIIVAVYDDKNVLQTVKQITETANANDILINEINLDEKYTGYTYKVYAWDSNTTAPLCNTHNGIL